MDNLIDFNTSNEEKVPSPSVTIDKSSLNPFIGSCSRRSTESTNNPFDTVEYQASNTDDPFELLNLKRNLLSDARQDNSRNGSTNSYFSNASSIQLSLSDIEYSPQNSTSVELINDAFMTTTSIKTENNSTMNNGFITEFIDASSMEVPKRRKSFSSSSNTINKPALKALGRFNSVDNPQKKSQQLLKLSFYNSPNSPMNDGSSSFNASMSDSVFHEAKKIVKKYSANDNIKDISFEDINNINPSWIDTSDVSETDVDLKDMKINVLPSSEKQQHVSTSNLDSAWLKAKLKDIKIKQEELSPTSTEIQTPDIPIKTEKDVSPEKKTLPKPKNDLDSMFNDLKTMMSEKNHPDAQKLLNKFQEMIAADTTSEISSTGSPVNENVPKPVEPPHGIVRQGTFDVTPSENSEKHTEETHSEPSNQALSDDIMEQISKLLSSANLNTIPLKAGVGNATNPTYIVVMPQIESLRTPIKPGRRSVSLSMAKKPEAALRAIENKRLFSNTPMKSSLAINNNKIPSTATRRNSFATPRPSVRPVPLEQKQPIGGCVRRSIAMSLNNKSPVQRMSATSTTKESMTSKKLFNTRPLPSSNRRSTLLKAPIPSIKISPPKKMLSSSTPRASGNVRSMPTGHSTPASNLKRLSQTPVPKQRLSMVQKPSTRTRSMTDGKNVSDMPGTAASKFKLPANKENKSLKLFDN
ncbi:unnamed protein product [Diamesa serratosioi]